MKANQERLYKDVEFFTQLKPSRNFANLESLAKCVDYIESVMASAGGESSRQNWNVGNNEYSNVIVSYNPEKEKRLIVGAHYDVCGDQPGADDNASAVAGLLECIRLTFEQKPDIDYRIDFVAYCLEEPPYFGTDKMGSYIHAKSLNDQNVDVIGMICFEMIGYFSDEPNSQKFPNPDLAALYPSTANFIIVVGIEEFKEFNELVHQKMSDGAEVDVQVISFPKFKDGLAGLSDHMNYWRFGYSALMINDTSFIRNPHYHEKTDTIDTLDFEKMTAVVSASYKAISGILD